MRRRKIVTEHFTQTSHITDFLGGESSDLSRLSNKRIFTAEKPLRDAKEDRSFPYF